MMLAIAWTMLFRQVPRMRCASTSDIGGNVGAGGIGGRDGRVALKLVWFLCSLSLELSLA